MPDPTDLQHAAAVVRRAMSHDRTTAPGGRWTPDTWALISELTDEVHTQLVPEQPRRCAEMAVDAWIITGRDLPDCVAQQLELRHFELPAPGRGVVGFTPGQLPRD